MHSSSPLEFSGSSLFSISCFVALLFWLIVEHDLCYI